MDDVYSVWASKDQRCVESSLNSASRRRRPQQRASRRGQRVATEDPKAAVTLMDRYPTDVTDRVVQNFVWHSFGTDPAVAATQIARIGDRRRAREHVSPDLGSLVRP